MARPRRERHPLPKAETRDLPEVEKTILCELAEGDKRTKTLREQVNKSGPTVHKHLNRLKAETKIEKSKETGAWHITEVGLRALQRSRIASATKLKFVDGSQYGKPRHFLVVAGLADNVANTDLQALMRYRSEAALELWTRQILGLALAKGILAKQYFDGRKQWDEITADEWIRIQKEVLSGVKDVGYAEDVTPKDLIAELMKPESGPLLRNMSESSQLVPDLGAYLANVSLARKTQIHRMDQGRSRRG
jgi:DNA-binding MarR family transcriptional regulator